MFNVQRTFNVYTRMYVAKPATDRTDPSLSFISVMHTGKPLSGEATIPADDFVWSKSSHIPGLPNPIPPRNEPLLYIPIQNNPHTSFDECSASTVAQGCGHIPNQPKHIRPRNEPMLYIPIRNNPHTSFDECEIGSHLASTVAQACAQEMQHGIHHNTRDVERGKHLYNTILICLCAYDLLLQNKETPTLVSIICLLLFFERHLIAFCHRWCCRFHLRIFCCECFLFSSLLEDGWS